MYKELIARLRMDKEMPTWDNPYATREPSSAELEAADAIERLLAERDAAVSDFFAIQKDVGKYIWDTTGGCALCKHEGKKPCPNAELMCSECWEWRGLQ